MKKVVATRMSMVKQIPISELGRVAMEGEEFSCTVDRFKWLTGNNRHRAVFATEVKETEEVKKKKNG